MKSEKLQPKSYQKITIGLIAIDLLVFFLIALIIYLNGASLFLKDFVISLIDFLNKNSGAIQTLSTVILVIITGFSVWFAGKTVRIMKKTEDERSRPRVILHIQQRENWLNFVDLIIGNYGLDVARDIKFWLNEDMNLLRESETLSGVSVIKNGIKNLVPQQVLRIPLLSLIGRVDELSKKNIVVAVTYKDSTSMRDFSERFSIDFNALIEHQIGKPPIHEISENIRATSKTLEKIERRLRDKRS